MAAFSGFILGTCSVNNGSKNVTIDVLDSTSSDPTEINSGTAIFIDNLPPVEAVSGSGISLEITLAENWPHASITAQPFTTIYTIEGLRDAVQRARNSTETYVAFATSFETLLTSTDPTVTIGTAPNELTLTPYQYLVDQFNASIGDIDAIKNGSLAPSKAEFEARTRGKYAGSGFVHWGKSSPDGVTTPSINEGMSTLTSKANTLRLGRDFADAVGVSTTPRPFVNVNNSLIEIKGANFGNTDVSEITLPPAPDGLDKRDGTGRYPDLATAIAAGTVDLNESVINRQDLVLLEVWHEKINDKDVVYPNGLVQYGVSTWEGISLQTGNVTQGYSAFYEGDTTTTGRSAVWSSLSDADKAKFIQDPLNNIYSDNGELIQVRARARVIRGLEGSWDLPTPVFDENNAVKMYAATYVKAQGKQTAITEWNDPAAGSDSFYMSGNSNYHNKIEKQVGIATTTENATHVAEEGLCMMIPICLVSRLNQGAYHPVFNSMGTTQFGTSDDWNQTPLNVDSISFCFDPANINESRGDIASGISGRPDGGLYDSIQAGQIKDLRIDASGTHTPQTAHHTLSKRARNGEARGWEKLPRIRSQVNGGSSINTGESYGVRVLTSSVSNVSGWLGSSQQAASGWLLLDGVAHKIFNARDNGTHTYLYSYTLPTGGNSVVGATVEAVFGDYIDAPYSEGLFQNVTGTPAEIAATFPNGVMGEWLPVIPDGTTKENKGTKKCLEMYQGLLSTDNGVTWANSSISFENTDNGHTSAWPANGVYIAPYRAKANFTEETEVTAYNFLYSNHKSAFTTSSNVSDNARILAQSIANTITTDTTTRARMILEYDTYFSDNVASTNSSLQPTTSKTVDSVISGSATSDGIQWETRVTSQDSLASLIIPYRQIKHDGSSYGAGLTFNYVDNTSNALDDNGELIQIGTARSLDDMNIILRENFNV